MDLSFQIYFLEGKTRRVVVCFLVLGFVYWYVTNDGGLGGERGFLCASHAPHVGTDRAQQGANGARRALPRAGSSGQVIKYGLRETLSFCATVLDITEHLGSTRLMRESNPCKMMNASTGFC